MAKHSTETDENNRGAYYFERKNTDYLLITFEIKDLFVLFYFCE